MPVPPCRKAWNTQILNGDKVHINLRAVPVLSSSPSASSTGELGLPDALSPRCLSLRLPLTKQPDRGWGSSAITRKTGPPLCQGRDAAPGGAFPLPLGATARGQGSLLHTPPTHPRRAWGQPWGQIWGQGCKCQAGTAPLFQRMLFHPTHTTTTTPAAPAMQAAPLPRGFGGVGEGGKRGWGSEGVSWGGGGGAVLTCCWL